MARTHVRRVRKRDGTLRPFDQERITFAIYKAAASVGGRNQRRSRRLSDRVVMTVDDRFEEGDIPTVEEIQDIIEEVLITAGHVKTARAYIVYRESRRSAREQSKGASRASHGPVPHRTLWDTLSWNVRNQCHTVDELRKLVSSGSLDKVIRSSEARFDRELDAVAREIADKRDSVRLAIVAGPSSSGKTTTTWRISEKLARKGIELVAINVDNYYRNLDDQPRDDRGDYDYETPEAIDLPLLNEHLERLVTGKTIQSPIFDFKSGSRTEETIPIRLEKNQIALIDTLHGMYKGLTVQIPEEVKYKIYIEALLQLLDSQGEWVRFTDLRLMRRMARDSKHRNVSPRQTLEHWHYVRRSEKKHILPYVGDADFVLNGSLPYELCLYKPMLKEFFQEYALNPTEAPEDALERAQRIHSLLEQIPEAESSDAISKLSVVREFIGGGVIQ